MKTKEEIIKEAYGNRFEELKSFICMHDGWCQDRQYNQIDCPRPIDYKDAITEYIRADNGERMVDVFRWMPKELEGIGDNNGWIKIESEKDLPKEGGECFVIDSTGKIEIVHYRYLRNCILEGWPYTHYQPINKPLKPLY